jgi:hypothetical protein
MQTFCGMFSAFITLKIFFSNSPLIFLRHESINNISWMNIKISARIVFMIASCFRRRPCFWCSTGIVISAGCSTGCFFSVSDSGPVSIRK